MPVLSAGNLSGFKFFSPFCFWDVKANLNPSDRNYSKEIHRVYTKALHFSNFKIFHWDFHQNMFTVKKKKSVCIWNGVFLTNSVCRSTCCLTSKRSSPAREEAQSPGGLGGFPSMWASAPQQWGPSPRLRYIHVCFGRCFLLAMSIPKASRSPLLLH